MGRVLGGSGGLGWGGWTGGEVREKRVCAFLGGGGLKGRRRGRGWGGEGLCLPIRTSRRGAKECRVRL